MIIKALSPHSSIQSLVRFSYLYHSYSHTQQFPASLYFLISSLTSSSTHRLCPPPSHTYLPFFLPHTLINTLPCHSTPYLFSSSTICWLTCLPTYCFTQTLSRSAILFAHSLTSSLKPFSYVHVRMFMSC